LTVSSVSHLRTLVELLQQRAQGSPSDIAHRLPSPEGAAEALATFLRLCVRGCRRDSSSSAAWAAGFPRLASTVPDARVEAALAIGTLASSLESHLARPMRTLHPTTYRDAGLPHDPARTRYHQTFAWSRPTCSPTGSSATSPSPP